MSKKIELKKYQLSHINSNWCISWQENNSIAYRTATKLEFYLWKYFGGIIAKWNERSF